MNSRAWLAVLLLVVASGAARAQELIADLSDHLIAISTEFTGADVVLFGAIEQAADIAVIVRGPAETVTVRRKDQTAGLWMNADSMTFAEVPSFYVVASNRPLAEFAGEAPLERHGIGLDNLRLVPTDAEGRTVQEIAEFRAALIRNQQQDGIYGTAPGRVTLLGNRLFRTDIYFPSNLPTGQYLVSVFLFRDGAVVDAQTTPLIVTQVGLSADLVAFSERHAAAYGLAAILVAVAGGWLASALFRPS